MVQMLKSKVRMLKQTRTALTVAANVRTRGRKWMATRERILLRDGYMCQCEDCKGTKLLAQEVDHVVPLERGGTDDDANLRSMNVECHKRKTAADAGSHLRGARIE